jgi:hypothetical protein
MTAVPTPSNTPGPDDTGGDMRQTYARVLVVWVLVLLALFAVSRYFD